MRFAALEKDNHETGEYVIVLDTKEVRALVDAVEAAANANKRKGVFRKLLQQLENLPGYGR